MRTTILTIVLLVIFFESIPQSLPRFQEEKKPKRFSGQIFEDLENKEIDIEYWTFGFVHPDSAILTRLIQLLPNLNLHYESIYFEADSASRKYPNAYVLETKDHAVYDEGGLTNRIKRLAKVIKRTEITLGQIGYAYKARDVNDIVEPNKKEKQNKATKKLSGKVFDETGRPLPFASVGILGKNIGVISDSNGVFDLEIKKERKKDTLTISYIGYEIKNISISKIDFSKTLEIRLRSAFVPLKEVEVVAKLQTKKVVLGQKRGSNNFGFIYGAGSGAEIARLFNPKKNELYINEVSVFLSNKKKEGFNLLLNIYDQDAVTKLPGKQLLKEAVVVHSEIQNGWLTINMNKHDLLVNKPFFVSFQWVDPEVSNPTVSLAGPKVETYIRTVALGSWQKTNDFANTVIKMDGTIIK